MSDLNPSRNIENPSRNIEPRRGRANRFASQTVVQGAKSLGLRLVCRDALTIRRRRAGKGWTYLDENNSAIRDPALCRRLDRLAVPPAYREVLYAQDRTAHLQAVGRDAAGRLQYRYHPKWEKVREIRTTRRLQRLGKAMPHVVRSVAQRLSAPELNLAFVCSAVIELVARTAIRPGSESHARLRGTRGAATLLKSNVTIAGADITLSFRAKGGKSIVKEFQAPRLADALRRLRELPGRRLFQCRDEKDAVRAITTRDVNSFLREVAGVHITLKDFRTLIASASVLEALTRTTPAGSERQRARQVKQAIRAVADELANTPAICRKSYVNSAVIDAFEDGVLERFADSLKKCRSRRGRVQALCEIVATA